jgi:hypothetical protein
MRALVYTGPNALELREESVPVAVDGEVVVKVEAVGICGSDMHAYHGYDSRRPAPLILGHEAAGRGAAAGTAGRGARRRYRRRRDRTDVGPGCAPFWRKGPAGRRDQSASARRAPSQ